jgi:hypothetical protein
MPLLTILVLRGRQHNRQPLPMEWALAGRPVFSADERRIYRLLREALPHHVILSKLPLVRFCQPTDADEVRYWYDLLGTTHVTFAICSANGRVLAAIDLEAEHTLSSRIAQIKQNVLNVCRVNYLVCNTERAPSIAQLRALVPPHVERARAPATLDEARDQLAHTVASRRAQRHANWQDSSVFQDSFFALDSRFDGFTQSEFPPLADRSDEPGLTNDIAGIVVDSEPMPLHGKL